MKTNLRLREKFTGIGVEVGWFSGEEFALFSLIICEPMHDGLEIISIKIFKFILSIWIVFDD